MIKTIIQKLFFRKNKKEEILKDLKSSPNFTSNEEIEPLERKITSSEINLEEGERKSIVFPGFGKQNGFKVTNLYFKLGEHIKHGDIICKIENEKISLEFESYFSGRVEFICRLNQDLTKGTEICRLIG